MLKREQHKDSSETNQGTISSITLTKIQLADKRLLISRAILSGDKGMWDNRHLRSLKGQNLGI